MSESGPVKRPLKTSEEIKIFSDLYRVAPNAWRVAKDGKFWLLKTAKTKDTASKMLLRREWEISRNLQHPCEGGGSPLPANLPSNFSKIPP